MVDLHSCIKREARPPEGDRAEAAREWEADHSVASSGKVIVPASYEATRAGTAATR